MSSPDISELCAVDKNMFYRKGFFWIIAEVTKRRGFIIYLLFHKIGMSESGMPDSYSMKDTFLLSSEFRYVVGRNEGDYFM